MKLKLTAKLLITIGLAFVASKSAPCQTLVASATELTEECKKEAERAKPVPEVIAHLSSEASGRAKDDLQHLAEAGGRMREIMKNGIPQDPEQTKAYIDQLKAAREEMAAAKNSVERDFERAPNAADHVLGSRFGEARVNEIFRGLEKASNVGSSGPRFDGQPPDESIGEWIQKSLGVPVTPDTDVFGVRAGLTLKSNYQLAPVEERREIQKTFHDIPGGVVLEGKAKGLGPITKIVFDGRSDAFIVNDNTVYFVRVPRKTVAMIVKAIAQDDNMGVSLSTPPKVYGALPKDSPVTWNLMLLDNFFGNIAFGTQRDWLTGYKFANNYQPREYRGDQDANAAAFFRFTGVEFQIKDQVYQIAQEAFEARSIPLQEATAADGGLLASDSGTVPREWQENLRHIADNISWYRHEKLVDQVFAYAELAAFIRAVKSQGNVDLNALANQAEAETAIWEALH